MTRILAALTLLSALTKLTWPRAERWLRRQAEPIVMRGFINDNHAERDTAYQAAGVLDRAAAHATNIAIREGKRTDAALAQYAELTRRINVLDFRIAREETPAKVPAVMPEVKVGDQVDIGGGRWLTVIRVNRKSVTTTSGTRWAAAEILGVRTPCPHDSASGVDQAPFGPGKVWRCEGCGKEWKEA